MSRHRGFLASVAAASRAFERQQRAHARAVARAEREQERAFRVMERDQKLAVKMTEREQRLARKEQAEAYREHREAEAEQLNTEVAERIEQLQHVLVARPSATVYGTPAPRLGPDAVVSLSFARLRRTHVGQEFSPEFAAGPEPPAPDVQLFRVEAPPRPGFVSRLFGGQKRYDSALAVAEQSARERLEAAQARYQKDLPEWEARVAGARAAHVAAEREKRQAVSTHNEEIDRWQQAFRERDQDAVIQYLSLVLDGSQYDEGFPEEFRMAYSPESREVVLEQVLPTIEVIPAVKDYSYVKAKDEIREKPRPRGEVTSLYRSVIAALTLRTVGELFGATAQDIVTTVTFNGILTTIDPATGKDVRPCVISVRTTRDQFSALHLDRVDPTACLASLGASVSKRPEELSPVRPVIEFDMADRRFVPSQDALAELDRRPNIMDLSPFEFENLVTNLFSKMGLDAKQTCSSRDGGVDCVAFDTRPVLGGKVVIQAKRYKNTVGVSAVRDLFGTMMNEGANKGILVTTAGYGPDAHDFAKDKPIELIDGGGLLYLLDQQGVQARIVMPV